MTTTCQTCHEPIVIAPSKRVQVCKNCQSIYRTGFSLKEIARQKAKESMERSRLKSKAKQDLKPKPTYTIPTRSAKGAKQERQISATKTKLKREALEAGHIECQGCGGYFKGIDGSHIVPVSQSSALASDPNNITLLCRGCHNLWEYGYAHEMIELKCFVKDMRYMFDKDNARFWNIHTRLVEEYNLRPTPKLDRVISKLERFE